jgi:hypothetical protein
MGGVSTAARLEGYDELPAHPAARPADMPLAEPQLQRPHTDVGAALGGERAASKRHRRSRSASPDRVRRKQHKREKEKSHKEKKHKRHKEKSHKDRSHKDQRARGDESGRHRDREHRHRSDR